TVNEQYELKNGLSVLAAWSFVEETFVLTMADHVFGDEVMDLARQHTPAPGHATLLVDAKIDTIFDMDDATKVQVEDGKVQAIGKQLQEFNAIDTGVFICTDGLMEALAHIHAQQGDASLSDGVQHLAASGRMDTLDIGDGFWQDVDTPEMLAHATEMLEEQAGVVH
ncbi:MAG TPA: hypothetical protein VKP65_11185, partial [Rhodothermales bacterium]|nr:hypothetical protein [Rhodothermales bacterium]